MHGASDIESMSGLPAAFRKKLGADCETGVPKIKKALRSKLDETVKYLFEYPDGATVEAALMSYKYGRTLCVSTQVGCNMGCVFCASAIGGKLRDLDAGEILGQVYAASLDCGGRIGGVVMMGMGRAARQLRKLGEVHRACHFAGRAEYQRPADIPLDLRALRQDHPPLAGKVRYHPLRYPSTPPTTRRAAG
jgi:adenine C2-methylase RlmN of 23S rRNA A2503 and tRNA A37